MFGAPHAVTASTLRLVPLPRRPLDPSGSDETGPEASGQVRRWYANELGWPTASGDPLRLVVGARFDVLDVPAEAGRGALRHLVPGSPVAVHGGRMRLLVAPGSAEELPGLLEWLDWGSLPLDLVAIGAGGLMDAPLPPGFCEERGAPRARETGGPLPGESDAAMPRGTGVPSPRETDVPLPPGTDTPLRHALPPSGPGSRAGRPLPLGPVGSQGAAVWLRPPEPGCEVEASLPTLSALGGGGDAPDLVRLVDTVATRCHRIRLRRACAQPPALRAQGR
ncbi:SCO3374 family protein [Streptomyces sp. NPDC002788]